MRAHKGFTLAELLITVAIIAVLVAIAIPVFSASLEKAQAATCMANRRSFYGELVTTYIMDGKIDSTNEPNISSCVCPANGKISWAQQGNSFSVSCSIHKEVVGAEDMTGALEQSSSFVQFMEQWMEAPENAKLNNGNKGKLYEAYYADYPAVQMSEDYKATLNAAPGFNKTLKDKSLYWWTYPVTNGDGDVLYTVTYANALSDTTAWTNSQRWKLSGGYVVIANGKTYYRSNTGKTVEPGNSTCPYKTEDALEAELIKNGYLVLQP